MTIAFRFPLPPLETLSSKAAVQLNDDTPRFEFAQMLTGDLGAVKLPSTDDKRVGGKIDRWPVLSDSQGTDELGDTKTKAFTAGGSTGSIDGNSRTGNAKLGVELLRIRIPEKDSDNRQLKADLVEFSDNPQQQAVTPELAPSSIAGHEIDVREAGRMVLPQLETVQPGKAEAAVNAEGRRSVSAIQKPIVLPAAAEARNTSAPFSRPEVVLQVAEPKEPGPAHVSAQALSGTTQLSPPNTMSHAGAVDSMLSIISPVSPGQEPEPPVPTRNLSAPQFATPVQSIASVLQQARVPDSIRVSLHPAELGPIQIVIQRADEGVRIHLTADTDVGYNALVAERERIEEVLRDVRHNLQAYGEDSSRQALNKQTMNREQREDQGKEEASWSFDRALDEGLRGDEQHKIPSDQRRKV